MIFDKPMSVTLIASVVNRHTEKDIWCEDFRLDVPDPAKHRLNNRFVYQNLRNYSENGLVFLLKQIFIMFVEDNDLHIPTKDWYVTMVVVDVQTHTSAQAVKDLPAYVPCIGTDTNVIRKVFASAQNPT